MLTAILTCFVIAIADGDTLTARCDDQNIKVRLHGIDAPEKRQAFGERSKQALATLCFNQQAKIQPITKDRYRRVVAKVECQGKDVGTEQVKAGMAWVYRKYDPNSKLIPLEDLASTFKVGLWSEVAVPPWEFRRK